MQPNQQRNEQMNIDEETKHLLDLADNEEIIYRTIRQTMTKNITPAEKEMDEQTIGWYDKLEQLDEELKEELKEELNEFNFDIDW